MFGSAKAYWSGETLQKRLPGLITPQSAYDPNRIDCASYRLSIGNEIYVSPSTGISNPESVTVRRLDPDAAFTIPAGQFALLVTEESVEIPDDAIGFISIRAKTKFRGLVNVSGFHVDPGFKGQLTFAVFNAGPLPIHLRRGQEIFVLWYAYLDQQTKLKKSDPPRVGLDVDLIQGISGELESFASLSNKIRTLDQDIRDKVHSIEKEQQFYRAVLVWAVPLLVAAAVALTSWVLRGPSREQQMDSNVANIGESQSRDANNHDGVPNINASANSVTEVAKNQR